ncbi:MAG: DUF3108 domain-containing protein [Candidatus Alcyoniella australis]|nr:DUF3108 domain-containing protein [Candidatus Alcyoniella australis]
MIKRVSILLWLLLVALLLVPTIASAGAQFQGERLSYQFGWNGIPAAEIDVEIDVVDYFGNQCYEIKIHGRTKRAIDLIWKMRDEFVTFTKTADLNPIRYSFYQREGRFTQDTDIIWNYETNVARSTRVKKHRRMKDREVEADKYMDPISALFFVRTQDLDVGDVQRLSVFDGKRTHLLEYKVVSREIINVPRGRFAALKIAPRIVSSSEQDKSSGTEKVREVYFYVSDDAQRLLLRFEAEAFVGQIYGELQ